MINGMSFEVWDKNVHERLKFYTQTPNYIDECMKDFYQMSNDNIRSWKRITEISMSPGIVKEKLQPSKVFGGEASQSAIVCAITAVINHDVKFSTDFIG